MKILEFIQYNKLDVATQLKIKAWLEKYEKYFNFYDIDFDTAILALADNVISHLKLNTALKEAIIDYIKSLYLIADDLSIVLLPFKQFNQNQIDNISRFQY